MTTQATVVCDSLAPSGIRLTTILLTYPTIIHQDILTHRTIYKMVVPVGGTLSTILELDANKSTNSNRAKPTKQVLSEVYNHPFCPTRFPKRAASMHSSQGYLSTSGWRHFVARHVWLKARYVALTIALLLMLIGVHKQIANRVLMPWMYTTLVATAIDEWWKHFFVLRNHYMAQDEVQEIASVAQIAYDASIPKFISEGGWHLPFVTSTEYDKWPEATCIALSVARCARTSYARSHQEMIHVAGIRPLASDIELFTRLTSQTPEHAGPKEHQAQASTDQHHISGTLVGWTQLRHHTTKQQPAYPPPHREHDAPKS